MTTEWTAEELRATGYRAVDLVVEHLTRLPGGPVFQPVPPGVVQTFEAEGVPRAGAPVAAVLEEFATRVEPWPFGNGHPRFFGWVNPPPHPLGVFAELLAAAMNPSVAGGNHAAVHVERQVVRWFAELAGFPPDATGLLVSGGSAATLTALAVARHRATPAPDPVSAPVRPPTATRAGAMGGDHAGAGAGSGGTLYVGVEGHVSIRKAARLLGIGDANVRVVASDGADRMSARALRATIREDLRAGRAPLAVVATAGTVNTGAVDDIDAIAGVCAEFGVWLHVDAAYGGPAVLLLDGHREARAGIARADSVGLDPHKWLYAPVGAGLVLLRDPAAARAAFSLVPDYLRTDGDVDGVGGPVWFSEIGFDQTRPFRALKVWMLLKHLGLDGYRARIEHDLAVAARIAERVAAAPELELLAHGLSVVCFRVRADDDTNRRVLRAVQLGGTAFLSGTTVGAAFALRACVVNPRSSPADADTLVAAVRHAWREQAAT
ncbi:pyridoxal phosphate-dependent decarboxylase family protein [Dactylosporangium matsuzakiense]|uniref:Pyridoxal-dependent decarboxylase n=1 Tax=Dactylosporangium matsuzakiense TaxID=53360 RepID=A0A9W6KPV7_9ACTN|nr:pyridoxal-dependent decarboxylase [Dactylosporangium matsuzakiense]UWZ42000.1 hypothetical protein Dmats_30850 [Dactylosporangium matsuzakiense]GLL04920.1 pyridoxal-dependent decarboxylase [Dactylosporangium matsuzakiense]